MKRHFHSTLLAGLCLGVIHTAAGQGEHELRQDMMPITLSEPGSYKAVENLSLGETFIPRGASWRYLDDGSNQGTAWRNSGFDDSGWSVGPARFGFGESGLATVLNDNDQITTYFRTTFVVDTPGPIGDMELLIQRDDGFVAYLNGTEVARDNMPGGTISYNTPASSDLDNSLDEIRYGSFDVNHTLLVAGTNTFALEIHNASSTDGDLSFNALVTGAFTGADSHGITITASGVLLDLNGFTLRGSPGETEDGVRIASTARNVEVRNGTICQWGDNGIDAGEVFPSQTATGSVFRQLRICENFRDGIKAGPNTLVDRVTSSSNGRLNVDSFYEVGVGIKVYRGSLVSECIVMSNHFHGILPRSRSEVHNCIIYHNGHDGVHAGTDSLITGTIVSKGEKNADGIEVNGDSLVSHTISYDNSDDGMKSRGLGNVTFYRVNASLNFSDGVHTEADGNLVLESNTVGNGDDGVVLDDGGGSLVFRNLCLINGLPTGNGVGVRSDASGSWIHSNHAVGNEIGIQTIGSGASLVTENSVVASDQDNYLIPNQNQTGPFSSNPVNDGPWVNFDY